MFPLAMYYIFMGKNPVYLSLPLSLGVSSGAILVFDVPSKGSNITLSEVLEEHKESITDMASECSGSQVQHVCACFACALSVGCLPELLDTSNISKNDRLPKRNMTLCNTSRNYNPSMNYST